MSLSAYCIGHITTGRFMGRVNQHMKVLYCKMPTISKQLPTFLGFEQPTWRLDVSVLPLPHRGVSQNYQQHQFPHPKKSADHLLGTPAEKTSFVIEVK